MTKCEVRVSHQECKTRIQPKVVPEHDFCVSILKHEARVQK